MARPIVCDTPGCEGMASVLITFLEGGVTQGMCGEHMAAMVMGMAAEIMESVDLAAMDVDANAAGEAPSAPGDGDDIGGDDSDDTDDVTHGDVVTA